MATKKNKKRERKRKKGENRLRVLRVSLSHESQ